MRCVKCGDKTEVLETINKGTKNRRRRRCLNPHCQFRFTTLEVGVDAIKAEAEHEALKRMRQMSPPGYDAEAVAAALAVDRRREQIKRAARQRAERFEDEDTTPEHLDGAGLRRELHGY